METLQVLFVEMRFVVPPDEPNEEIDVADGRLSGRMRPEDHRGSHAVGVDRVRRVQLRAAFHEAIQGLLGRSRRMTSPELRTGDRHAERRRMVYLAAWRAVWIGSQKA